MALTLLCVGDVVGQPGRQVLSQHLPRLVEEHQIDGVIANVENAAAGSGLTPALYDKFCQYGVDLMTMGDHVFRKLSIAPVLEQSGRIARPANLPPEAPGPEVIFGELRNGHRIAVISLLGRVFMNMQADCPYHTIDRLLKGIPMQVKTVVVDMHAEATSEKIAMGWHLDGRVSVVFGTHTHTPTADERILPNGTAYITDLGMTGPYDSVLGRRKDRVLKAMTTSVPTPFDVATDDPRLCGILVKIDPATGKSFHIERIRVDGVSEPDLNSGKS